MTKFKDTVDNTWTVKMRKPKRVKELNPETLRNKTYKRSRHMVTKVAPQDRTLKNIPKYADGRSKVDFKDWMQIKTIKSDDPDKISTVGKSDADGKYYGWSHRAIYGFGVGDVVPADAEGNSSGKEYTIKTDDQALQAAKDFASEIQ